MNLLKGALGEQGTLDFLVAERLITNNLDVTNAHLCLLVYDDIQDYAVLVGHVIPLHNVDVGIVEPLVIKVFLGQKLRSTDGIGCYLSPFEQSQFSFHGFAFRLFQSNIIDFRHAWQRLQIDVQINLVTYNRVGRYRNVGKQAMLPIALHGICNVITRHRDGLSYR